MAVGDPRTNSLLVNAARDAMAEIAEMIGRLDATDQKKQHIYVHSLEHADVDSVANVLRGMLGDQTATSNRNAAGRLTDDERPLKAQACPGKHAPGVRDRRQESTPLRMPIVAELGLGCLGQEVEPVPERGQRASRAERRYCIV